MNIRFESITKENYDDVCLLDVKDEQQDFIAYNAFSLVETFYNEGYVAKAIYHDDLLIGFTMLVYPSVDRSEIWRFMIDEKYQNKGLGKRAFQILLEFIARNHEIKTIALSYDPDNVVAQNLYRSFGFIEIGMDDDNEEIVAELRLDFNKNCDQNI